VQWRQPLRGVRQAAELPGCWRSSGTRWQCSTEMHALQSWVCWSRGSHFEIPSVSPESPGLLVARVTGSACWFLVKHTTRTHPRINAVRYSRWGVLGHPAIPAFCLGWDVRESPGSVGQTWALFSGARSISWWRTAWRRSGLGCIVVRTAQPGAELRWGSSQSWKTVTQAGVPIDCGLSGGQARVVMALGDCHKSHGAGCWRLSGGSGRATSPGALLGNL